MTVTRTQAGKTPKKTEHPGFVQTPGTYKKPRSRKSELRSDDSDAMDSTGPEDNAIETHSVNTAHEKTEKAQKNMNGFANGHANGHANGYANGYAKEPTEHSNEKAVVKDHRYDPAPHFDFGGSLGNLALIIGFPLLMYYMWIGATYYDGQAPLPQEGESLKAFFQHLGGLIYEGAYPSAKAWTIYWVFSVFQLCLYMYAPGIWTKGKPLPHEGGRQLDYYCSAMWSWWITIILANALHFGGIFKLYTIIDEFGPIMSVAIISGFLVSIGLYVAAVARGKQHRVTGYPIHDFFMGAELNPRLFDVVDLKMFFEVRLPWFILFLLTLGACTRQYEQYGYVSGNLIFLLIAHWLYTNACAKGEEYITITWDMYYEKLGFMLAFWNMAGVPLSYCHCTIYLANHDPKTYEWNKYAISALIVVYLFVYWVWDTTNSQKNHYRRAESGFEAKRNAFPQLPWRHVKNPKIIKTANGGTILADGWYGIARKIHYTCDMFFAITWGAITGFNSPFPWFYSVFFAVMIVHRALRDIQKCREKYGDAWREYERQVPYLFIPYVY